MDEADIRDDPSPRRLQIGSAGAPDAAGPLHPDRASRADCGRMVAELESTGLFRVLRRVPALSAAAPGGAGCAVGVGLDLESTGLDAADEPISLAMVKFSYSRPDSRLLGVVDTFDALREPVRPIPSAITRLTGISPADVAGRVIDPAAVDRFLDGVAFVVAHNAAFDRKMAEACWPRFAALPWCCSCTGVDWAERGFEGGARLGHLLMQAGFYHDGHRALTDVHAMLHLLAAPGFLGGPSALAELLERARKPTSRLWADGAPYHAKDKLRKASYRWFDGLHGSPRAWYKDVAPDLVEDELAFLSREVYGDSDRSPCVVPLTAMDRFSVRAGIPRDRPPTAPSQMRGRVR